ncbi:hypothetical protein PGTUg99_018893 [Puccinia graminis f. sp. tritici]|uniref:CxC1-like cysteine cluster associated with KDZ transposases domain-containing protein n=1 Tax=Puccinia graminis f. sp. tritici TaxID=56615 RepID=A0A5B0NJ44_PUCGR|nr:hypothetical protein PGTUg99_018893 [Puccinia graminis f. sp. tritici]
MTRDGRFASGYPLISGYPLLISAKLPNSAEIKSGYPDISGYPDAKRPPLIMTCGQHFLDYLKNIVTIDFSRSSTSQDHRLLKTIDFSRPLTSQDHRLLKIIDFSRPSTSQDHRLLKTIDFSRPSTSQDHQILESSKTNSSWAVLARATPVLDSLLRGERVQSSIAVSTSPNLPNNDSHEHSTPDFDPPDEPYHDSSPYDENPLSTWSSIPWDISMDTTGNNTTNSQLPTVNDEDLAALRHHDRRVEFQTRASNWEGVMNKIFSAYLWLKEKTDNWTTEASFKSYDSRFCKCQEHEVRSKQWIDLVDLAGQQRVKFEFCRCMPRSVTLLANGFLPSSPIKPTTGFSMRLLAYHDYAWNHSNVRMAPFAETQRKFSEDRSEVLWNRRQTKGRDLRSCMSSAVLLYRDLLSRNENLIQTILGLTKQQKMALTTCPACFGPSMRTGLHRLPSVDKRLIISFDGNFQHRHQKKAGSDHIPLVTPDIFIQPSELDEVLTYITQQEKAKKIPKKVCEFTS